jgi:hypothetical protein
VAFPVTVHFDSTPGTASSSADFLGANGILTFEPGETSKSVQVVTVNDGVFEPNEQLYLNLSSSTGLGISDAQAVGSILNDDSEGPGLTISKNHKIATWRDIDGDTVTLKVNNGC